MNIKQHCICVYSNIIIAILYLYISKCCENNISDIVKNSMAINVSLNSLILVNVFSNISQIFGKTFCRQSTHVLCLLGVVEKRKQH